jgi:hypothetical protein
MKDDNPDLALAVRTTNSRTHKELAAGKARFPYIGWLPLCRLLVLAEKEYELAPNVPPSEQYDLMISYFRIRRDLLSFSTNLITIPASDCGEGREGDGCTVSSYLQLQECVVNLIQFHITILCFTK